LLARVYLLLRCRQKTDAHLRPAFVRVLTSLANRFCSLVAREIKFACLRGSFTTQEINPAHLRDSFTAQEINLACLHGSFTAREICPARLHGSFTARGICPAHLRGSFTAQEITKYKILTFNTKYYERNYCTYLFETVEERNSRSIQRKY
jgi:hypothetical protein